MAANLGARLRWLQRSLRAEACPDCPPFALVTEDTNGNLPAGAYQEANRATDWPSQATGSGLLRRGDLDPPPPPPSWEMTSAATAKWLHDVGSSALWGMHTPRVWPALRDWLAAVPPRGNLPQVDHPGLRDPDLDQ